MGNIYSTNHALLVWQWPGFTYRLVLKQKEKSALWAYAKGLGNSERCLLRWDVGVTRGDAFDYGVEEETSLIISRRVDLLVVGASRYGVGSSPRWIVRRLAGNDSPRASPPKHALINAKN